MLFLDSRAAVEFYSFSIVLERGKHLKLWQINPKMYAWNDATRGNGVVRPDFCQNEFTCCGKKAGLPGNSVGGKL